jgi:hypothetical protein
MIKKHWPPRNAGLVMCMAMAGASGCEGFESSEGGSENNADER